MNANVLVLEGVGKSFREYPSQILRFATWAGISVRNVQEHWVLRNISFRLGRGEAVGIVGQNGAGKSTLLKLITGTLRQTTGSLTVNGRISAILELGMGFNPDLTGRQNVMHTAGLMGFSQADIERAIPDIEAFAEIGEYFDEPVRTYSSGMQMRVAFSVATAFRPEVLIVDEALSVGDAYFQHKSMGRIREFRRQGTTLLIVSHDRTAIQALCDRAILLDKGEMRMDGDPHTVMDYYNAMIAERENTAISSVKLESGKVQTTSGTGEAVVEKVGIYNAAGEPVEFINVGEPAELRIQVKAHTDIPRLVLGYLIKDRLGQDVFGTNTHHTGQALEQVRAGQVINYSIRFSTNMGAGAYSVSTALVSTDTHLVNNYEWRDLALVFTVMNVDRAYFVGSNWMPPSIAIDQS
ncbi:ABC transporter ATP-binding protein [Dyella sp. ASV21]|uniref:ABC transporter ATP-binding protein n=1 Tax=Dyella sp. ASV21 TaxID=2795114 RepID=UPI0018EADA7F|nr:ABC transporter ATP-binding protein [Dyella sp. ASV21]